ncbi:hypothetical protein HBI56_037100 [Parastagonospora nodorum]|nr:hypothetical protein HBH49_049650 [Parastagonospora nodorum]KAH4071129.1 hypothetical protein HBH50_076830 [Parastagonospora nodorum]KAH4093826.1 hypothetical protein HBH48_065080 [Parastagonospora nodorum]KAH4272088.1 hypothetical protein HBI03_022870 [Parastagonospora nodorum]KAH4276943.1 hypothetical protein HBI04_101700 [Parastagonospora nodorum]
METIDRCVDAIANCLELLFFVSRSGLSFGHHRPSKRSGNGMLECVQNMAAPSSRKETNRLEQRYAISAHIQRLESRDE